MRRPRAVASTKDTVGSAHQGDPRPSASPRTLCRGEKKPQGSLTKLWSLRTDELNLLAVGCRGGVKVFSVVGYSQPSGLDLRSSELAM